MRPLVASLLAVLFGTAVAGARCENGYTLFENLMGREDRPTCIKLFTNIKVSGRSLKSGAACGGKGAYPLTWEESAPASNDIPGSMYNALRTLIAIEEGSGKVVTNHVLVGGQQTGATADKKANWKWCVRLHSMPSLCARVCRREGAGRVWHVADVVNSHTRALAVLCVDRSAALRRL
jgi:hypothetical protein